jgi:hypothetical protein
LALLQRYTKGRVYADAHARFKRLASIMSDHMSGAEADMLLQSFETQLEMHVASRSRRTPGQPAAVLDPAVLTKKRKKAVGGRARASTEPRPASMKK